MFWSDPYKEQLIKRIESLIAAKEFVKAHDVCTESLERNPDDKKILALMSEIEQRVRRENEGKIENVIDSLGPLWQKEKYIEIIQKLQEVKMFSPEYPPLLATMAKAEKKYREKINENQEVEAKKIEEEIEDLFESTGFEEIIQRCQSLEASPFKTPKLANYLKKIRERVIDTQLNLKKDFIRSNKFDEIISFLEKLKSAAPDYKKLKDLIEETKLRKIHNISSESEEKSYEAIENIKTLLKLNKIDEAYYASKELEIFNPGSKIIKNLVKKAKAKFERKLRDETAAEIIEKQTVLKAEYTKNKNQFTKI